MTYLSDTSVAMLYLLGLGLLTGLSVFCDRGGVASDSFLGKIASQVNRVGCGLLWLGSAMLFVGYFAQSVDGGREFFVGMARWGTRLAFFAMLLVMVSSITSLTKTPRNPFRPQGLNKAKHFMFNFMHWMWSGIAGFIHVWAKFIANLPSNASDSDQISSSGFFYNSTTGKWDDGMDPFGIYYYDRDDDDD